MEDKKIQAETGSINNNQRGHDRGKDREEVLLNDKQQTEIHGGDVTCEEWRHRLLSLLLRRAATYKVSTGNVFIHKAVPFFCVFKKSNKCGDSNSKKITLTHSTSRQENAL